MLFLVSIVVFIKHKDDHVLLLFLYSLNFYCGRSNNIFEEAPETQPIKHC